MSAKRPQKKPSRSGNGRPPKPDYGRHPFSIKLILAKYGNHFLDSATTAAILRSKGFDKPIPKAVLEDSTFADLNKISDLSLHKQFGEYAAWIADLGPDSEAAHPDDLQLFLTYAHAINRLGRFPAMQEIVADRRKLANDKNNTDFEKSLRATLPKKIRLPYVDDKALDRFKSCIKDQPDVIDEPDAFWKLTTETAPIYTPIRFWPVDLICHLLVGADLGGLDNDERPVIVRLNLPEYLDDLNQAAFKRASEEHNAMGNDYRNLPAERRSRIRKELEEAGRRYATQAVPWLNEAEKLWKFTYWDEERKIYGKILDQAADWAKKHPGESVIEHLKLANISMILEKMEARNIRLVQKWARALLTGQGKGGK